MSGPALTGRAVVVTRPERADGPLAAALTARGAVPVHRPVLEIRSTDVRALDEALRTLDEVDWLVLTSARAVSALDDAGAFLDPPPSSLRVAVVGPKTAAAVHAAGWPVHVEPDPAGAAGLLLALEARGVDRRHRVLFPASAQVRPLLPDALRARGARVDLIPVYTPVARALSAREWDPTGAVPPWSALTFTSPSAVSAVVDGLPPSTIRALLTLPAAVQGPTTGAATRQAGWSQVLEAHPRTFDGLATALVEHFAGCEPTPSP